MREKNSKNLITGSVIAKLAAVFAAVFFGVLCFNLNRLNSFANEPDSPWLNDWEYSTVGFNIILGAFKGSGNNLEIEIPSEAVLEGEHYYVSICQTGNSLFPEEYKDKVVSFSVGEEVIIEKASALLEDMPNLKTVDLSKAVAGENMTDMRYMFFGCTNLESVDLSGLNTENVTEMGKMFQNCSKLKTVIFGERFNTENAVYMMDMFSNCESLESLDLRSFDTGKVVSMSDMFRECKSLKTLQLGNKFSTAKVTDISGMFIGCSSITELDLSNFSLAGMEKIPDGERIVFMLGDNDSLKVLKLPKNFGFVDKLQLPTVMFIKNDDNTIGTEEYSEATPYMAGRTMVVITDKEKVKIKASDKAVTYDGSDIDISDMFEIPETAGSASYEVTSDTGTLSGAILTVTKAGKYVISVYTEETSRYEAGSASATLTVKRAHGEGSITCDDVTYGSKPSPKATSSTNPGDPVFLYKLSSEGDNTYTVEIPTKPGKYTVKALFPETDLYECSATAEFTIKEAGDNGGKKENNGGNENGESREEKGNNGNNEEISKREEIFGDNPYYKALDDTRKILVPVDYEDKSGSSMNISGKDLAWNDVEGKSYWYENDIKQGTYFDSHAVLGDGTVRGREIYDGGSDGWYWLDAIYDGAKAIGKEVWMPYIYQNEEEWDETKMGEISYESDPGMADCVFDAMKNKRGKWVRYDENGAMLKGWVKIEGKLADLYPDQAGNTYYYDTRTGLMAKGEVTIDGEKRYFDEVSGALVQ